MLGVEGVAQDDEHPPSGGLTSPELGQVEIVRRVTGIHPEACPGRSRKSWPAGYCAASRRLSSVARAVSAIPPIPAIAGTGTAQTADRAIRGRSSVPAPPTRRAVRRSAAPRWASAAAPQPSPRRPHGAGLWPGWPTGALGEVVRDRCWQLQCPDNQFDGFAQRPPRRPTLQVADRAGAEPGAFPRLPPASGPMADPRVGHLRRSRVERSATSSSAFRGRGRRSRWGCRRSRTPRAGGAR